MGNIWHILGVVAASILLVAALGFWMGGGNDNAIPDVLLGENETLTAPLSPEELQIANPEITHTMNRLAIFTTNKGTFTIELFEDKMPITTGNFISLAEDGFYTNTKFHRIITNFMIQGGDPNTRNGNPEVYGTGGPGYAIQDEFVSDPLLSNTRGTIAMANTGQPNSGSSQFFINTVDNLILDFDKEPFTSKHPVFGRVIEGMDVIDTISRAETGERDIPTEPIIVESITIEAQRQ